ncbi:MAG: HEAT repeat domain-containing protein [Deltaproteobacteria bacterium]|nr:HEAT repeat domain-containing protein [Deltaproteobacteria bacterium]MBN2674375.1 HEAT repeat domain-containing protein [Deltaproteobacteria bacterium]
MGILDFLSKENRLSSKIEKNVKRANNKHTPKDYRQAALYEIIEHATDGNEQAISGLISRFAVIAEPSIEDEKEKEWVCNALIDIGEKALPLLKRALRSEESVNLVQRVFRNIVDEETYRKELLAVLDEFDTEYERNPDRKIQTIMALSELQGDDVAEKLVRFLEDVNETVRYQTVNALAEMEWEESREPLLKAMCEEESIRVRNEIIDVFARLEWSTAGYKKQVAALLPQGYKQDKSGKLIKLGNV